MSVKSIIRLSNRLLIWLQTNEKNENTAIVESMGAPNKSTTGAPKPNNADQGSQTLGLHQIGSAREEGERERQRYLTDRKWRLRAPLASPCWQ